MERPNIDTAADEAAREIIDSISVNEFREMQRLGRTSRISDIIHKHFQQVEQAGKQSNPAKEVRV